MTKPVVFVDRRLSGLLGASALLVLDGAIAWIFGSGVASGYLPPKDEGVFGVVKGLFCMWLIAWVVFAVGVYAFAKVVLWIEIGDQITFRRLLGIRTLPWSLVARFEMIDRDELPRHPGLEGVVVEFFSRKVFGIKGELKITAKDGNELEIRLKSTEWTQLKELEAERKAEVGVKPIRLTIGRAIGLLAGGLAALAVWIYLVYLVCSGEGRALFKGELQGRKAWIASGVIMIALPIGGCAACVCGTRHLFRRRRGSGQESTLPASPPRSTQR
jgi:hypothetical protein